MTGAIGADWDDAPPASALHLELGAWEGPLDLLLDLARRQKVDLRRISILDLVDQYLAFVTEARALSIELAADYLVMAAWLAYLKSALLLPGEAQEEPSPEELALRLRLRLERLAAMRDAGARLIARDRLGRDVFARGAPEGLRVERRALWQCDWFELVEAYGRLRARTAPAVHVVASRPVMGLDTALALLADLLADRVDWGELREFLPPAYGQWAEPALRRSALASSFLAALELARLGRAELAQDHAFGPLRLRAAG